MDTQTSEVPQMYIEIIDQSPSGYIRDDTRGTPYQEEITAPSVEFIPNTGKMSKAILDEKGKPTNRHRNVAIRYIKDCPYIEVEEQEKYGYEKNKIPSVDTIAIKKGKTLIKREGDVGLFDFLQKVFYNLNAPHRPKSAKAIFKVVEVEAKVSSLNEKDFLRGKAVGMVEELVMKQGNTWKFQENKIDNILTVLGVFGGESYADKVNVLIAQAKIDPEKFVQTITKMDEQTVTEITHAMQLDVIQFVGNTAQYIKDSKVIANLGDQTLAGNKKIERLSELLKTPEYAEAYNELKIKIEIAQENSLKV